MTEDGYTLRVVADPAMSMTVRIFAAEAARRLGLDEVDVEDLRLLATELLGNAVSTESPGLELSLAVPEGAWRLRARGAGPLTGADDGSIDRRAVLSGLASVVADGDELSLHPVDPR